MPVLKPILSRYARRPLTSRAIGSFQPANRGARLSNEIQHFAGPLCPVSQRSQTKEPITRSIFEALSTWILRIAALSVLSFAALQTVREQNRPSKADVQDAERVEIWVEYVNRELACGAQRKLTASRRAVQTSQCSTK
jgi:hypothetical protein